MVGAAGGVTKYARILLRRHVCITLNVIVGSEWELVDRLPAPPPPHPNSTSTHAPYCPATMTLDVKSNEVELLTETPPPPKLPALPAPYDEPCQPFQSDSPPRCPESKSPTPTQTTYSSQSNIEKLVDLKQVDVEVQPNGAEDLLLNEMIPVRCMSSSSSDYSPNTVSLSLVMTASVSYCVGYNRYLICCITDQVIFALRHMVISIKYYIDEYICMALYLISTNIAYTV